jgi:hypothetical protein
MSVYVICVIALLLASTAQGWMATSLAASRSSRQQSRRTLEMKGKGGRVPIDQRGEFIKQQRMMEMREKMQEQKKEGVPVFKVFVRPKVGGLWIPCGDLAGDQRATALVNAWTSGFMTDMYKGQLDQGIARSIFSQEDTFVKGLLENFKPFKKFKPEDLEFGYKIDFEGLEAKMGEQKVQPINKDMMKSWTDNLGEKFSGLFGGVGGVGGNKE